MLGCCNEASGDRDAKASPTWVALGLLRQSNYAADSRGCK